MKQQSLSSLALKQVLDAFVIPSNISRYISPELGLVRSIDGIKDIGYSVLKKGKPYRLMEGRVVCLYSGSARIRVNLIEMYLCPYSLCVVSPGTVIELLDVSPDCNLIMLAFANSFMENWQKEDLLTAYMQGRVNFVLSLNEPEGHRIEEFFSLIWNVLHDESFSRETVQALISALFHQINCFHKQKAAVEKKKNSRQEEVFNRFINLVNKYAVRERNVSFYADNLFLTSRYLSTVIRNVSGKTVMDWVNEAVIQEAKLQLCYTDKLVYQIADDLNFPNASFFCKFFRRISGKTPYEYRKERYK